MPGRAAAGCLALVSSLALIAGCPGPTAADGGGSTGGGTSTNGGNGGTSSSGGTSGGAVQSCTDYANAICGLYQSCSNGFETVFEFGDLATCVSQYDTLCENRLAAPNTANSASQVEVCAQALPEEACTSLYGSDNTAPCEAAQGPLAGGAPCSSNAQCQSAYCGISKVAVCGVCAPEPVAGADCSLNQCGVGDICLRASQTCSAPVADGGACTTEGDCLFGFSCLDGDGGLLICAPAAAAGQPCDYHSLVGPGCAGRQGLYCKRTGDGGSCTPFGLADAGQPCGNVAGLDTLCSTAGVCQKSQPDAGVGLCLGSAPVGMPCDIDAGPACMLEAKCVLTGFTGTAGVCTEPVPATCP